MLNLDDLLPTAMSAARDAVAFIRATPPPTDPSAWERKGTADFVTQVDRDVEGLIVDRIHARFPDSQIMGEELSPQALSGDLVWIVDPLDGTTNYLHSFPAYAVSIAAVTDGVLRVGVVSDVARGDVFHAVAGEGAYRNGEPIRVSSRTQPSDFLIGTGFPFKHPVALPRYLRQLAVILRATSGVRRAGSAALDLAHLAAGWFDGFWELYLAPWDVAAGTLLVREAGGAVTDLEGSSDVLRGGAIVAGASDVHRWLLDVLRTA